MLRSAMRTRWRLRTDESWRRLILRWRVRPVWPACCQPPAWESNTDWLWYNFISSPRKPTLISLAVIDQTSRNILIQFLIITQCLLLSLTSISGSQSPGANIKPATRSASPPDTVKSLITRIIIVDSNHFQLNIVLGYKSKKMEPRIEIPSKNLLYNSDRFSKTACNSQSYREVFANNCCKILRTSSSSYFLNKMYSIVFGKFYMKLIFIVFNISVYCTCT